MNSDYLFFWGHSPSNPYGCLSNWYPSRFIKDGETFENTEQYMMYRKAVLMGDTISAQKILAQPNPKKVKSLGRKVKPWDEQKWIQHREQIMYDGCLAKFSQNADPREILLSTIGKQCVEASPYDRVWGVGMRASSPGLNDPKNWKGLNLLGKALDKVKTTLSYQLYRLIV